VSKRKLDVIQGTNNSRDDKASEIPFPYHYIFVNKTIEGQAEYFVAIRMFNVDSVVFVIDGC
jgi:hypothetical protein